MMRFHDFVPESEFEKSAFAAAKEAMRHFAAAGVEVWPILPGVGGSKK